MSLCDEHQQKTKRGQKIHTGPVVTFIDPDDHVLVIGDIMRRVIHGLYKRRGGRGEED